MMTITHTLRAHNLRVGHVRGVQPLPVTLTGDVDVDRETMAQAIRDCVARVLPKAPAARVRWNPSGTQALAYVQVPHRDGAGRSREMLVATFRVDAA